MQTIVFDVETGPLPEAELVAAIPAFDPAEVKTGNIKDPDKIAARIAEAEASQRRDFFDKAALDPLTGRVVAIGVLCFEAGGEFGPDFSKFDSAPQPSPDLRETHLIRPAATFSPERRRKSPTPVGEGQAGGA